MVRKTTVIETAADTFTALEIAWGDGSPEVIRLASQALPQGGLTASWIKEFWQQQKFPTHRVIYLLPPELVRYLTLTFRVLPAEQLEAAVKLEMENRIGERALWKLVGSQLQNEQISLRVAVIDHESLAKASALLEEAGLKVEWSGLASRGLQNFIFYHRDLLENETAQFAYLNVTHGQTEYGVITEDALVYRRVLELGNRDFTGVDAIEAQTELLEGLRLSFAFYKSFGQPQGYQLWLFGNDATVLTALQQALVRAKFAAVVPEKVHLGGVDLQGQIPRLAPLIGLALDQLGWNAGDQYRVYSLEQQKQEQSGKQFGWALKFGLVGLLILLGFWWNVQAEVVQNQTKLEWLARQKAEIAKLNHSVAVTRLNLAKIKSWEARSSLRGRELEFLLALEKQLPHTTVITDLTLEEGQVKNLSGVTPSVSLLMLKLKANPVLRTLKVKGNITATTKGLESFQLVSDVAEKESQGK